MMNRYHFLQKMQTKSENRTFHVLVGFLGDAAGGFNDILSMLATRVASARESDMVTPGIKSM